MKNFFKKFRHFSGNIKISLPMTKRKIGLWIWDINNNRIYLDDFWLEKFGFKKTRSYTMDTWMSSVHPDDSEKIKEIMADYIASGNNDGLEYEYRLKRNDGEYIWLFLIGQITRYKKGKPARMDGIIFDISGQKQIESELFTKNSEIEALYEESEAQNEEMAAIMDELQNNQMALEGANHKLKLSENKFRKIFENSPIGIIQSSLTGDILDANNAFLRIFGYDSFEDLMQCLKNTKNLYHETGSRERLLERLSKSDIVNALDITGKRKDNSIVYENVYMLKMSDEFTGEKYLTTFIEDITQLRSSQFERELLFNNSGDLLSISDLSGELKQINAAWTTILGWSLDELKNMNISSIIHPEDIQKTNEFIDKLMNSDKVLTFTNRYRNTNNEYRIIRWSSIAFRQINLVFSSGRDETERYEAELELKQLWDRLDTALKAGVIGLWDFDIKNDIIRMNSNMTELFGMKTNYIKNVMKNWKFLVHKDDYEGSLEEMNRLINNKSYTYATEYRAKLLDGSYRWFFSRGKAVEFDSEHNPLRAAGSIMDITEQKEAESKRIELELKMQQAQKLESLGVLAGGIAHDFNNLLTGILGNSDILLYELPQDKEIQQRLLEIKRATKLASQLTNQMLAYSGKGSFVIEHIDFNDLIIDMNSLLEASISKKVELSYSFLPKLPGIKGDATQIRQILMNLILNASDAIENNGRIDVKTSVDTLKQSDIEKLTINYNLTPGEYVQLEVTDTGSGIESEKLKQIFDPFFTTKFTGRGLGLSAVSGIIRSHNAGLLVESEPGKGTCFKLYFPVSSEASDQEKQMKKNRPEFRNRDLTILIADDEKYIRDLTTKMLNISGYKVILARNGREAIDVFTKQQKVVSCIILDLTMPELDGREALTGIRKIDANIPIIISSGYCEYDIVSKFSNEKISGFLQKPYNLEDIISAIEDAIH